MGRDILVMPLYAYLEPLFKTLRLAGYQECQHPRIDDDQSCMDCGALRGPLGFQGGYLEFKRKPIRYEVPPQ